jgi:hypothetical protein
LILGNHQGQSNHKSLHWLLVFLTIAFVFVIWFDLAPWLRGPDEWRWTLRPPVSPERMIVPAIVLLLYTLICAAWLRRTFTTMPIRFLLFLTFAAPIIQLALAFVVSHYPLLEFFGPTVSVHNSGYFTTAVATPNLNELLAHYPSIMPALPIHAQSHPPGPIVLQWLDWKFFEAVPALADPIGLSLRTLQCHNPGLMALDNAQIASASIGMLLPLIGGLAVWPLYAFGKRAVGERAALLVAALFPVMPLFAMWPSQWDQLYPLLLLLGLYLIHTGLEAHSLRRIFLAGLSLSIATFFSVGNAALIAIVGLYGVVWTWYNSRREPLPNQVRWWLKQLLAFTLGSASIWIVYAVLYQVNPIDVISTGSRLAWESTTGARSYGLWLLWNPIDFAIFLGIPIVILLLAKATRLRKWHWLPLTLVTITALIALDVSGIVRGEVGRLWMYFGPLIALVAFANDRPQDADVARNTHYVLLIGLLSLQLLVMNTRWLVSDSFLDEPPSRSVDFTAPQPTQLAAALFDHQIALRGYDVQLSGPRLDLTLYWQAVQQPPHAYTVFVHVLDAQGNSIGQQDNMPVQDQSPTSCWQPGEFVADPYSIELTTGQPAAIEVGLYRLDTGERLVLDDGSGTSIKLNLP